MMLMMITMHDEFAHFEILLRTLSLGVNVDDTVSSSLTESLSPRSRGTEEEELPDTCKILASEKALSTFDLFHNGFIIPDLPCWQWSHSFCGLQPG